MCNDICMNTTKKCVKITFCISFQKEEKGRESGKKNRQRKISQYSMMINQIDTMYEKKMKYELKSHIFAETKTNYHLSKARTISFVWPCRILTCISVRSLKNSLHYNSMCAY